ncbi:excalibur calcium-binding domain-containing protein [Rathayibacter festucae]|nr:excalibur calcium-binding domain-containing protein [Rathayibacter festucae]
MPHASPRRLAALTLSCLLTVGGSAAFAPASSAADAEIGITSSLVGPSAATESARAAGQYLNALVGGEVLARGESITSEFENYSFVMQTDGNAVIYDFNGRPTWSTGTQGSGDRLAMQNDGNVVIYSAEGRPVWSTGTSGNPGSLLIIQDDGNLVVYRADNSAAWASSQQTQPSAIGDTLNGGGELQTDRQLTSNDSGSRAVMQADGNFVVYSGGAARWSAGTSGSGNRLAMQSDGNAVVYSAGGSVRWQSGTSGNPGARMVMQNDGNLVIYGANGRALWSSTAPSAPAPTPTPQFGDVLPGGAELRSGQQLVSSNGGSRAAMQSDGNFVVYTGSRVRWSAGTSGPGNRLAMQSDGNAVVYSAANRVLWQTGTSGRPGARMVMQNDGNLVVYSTSNAVLWSSNPGNVVNCDSFRSQAEAQAWFERYRGYNDPGDLDRNNDGRACEDFRY